MKLFWLLAISVCIASNTEPSTTLNQTCNGCLIDPRNFGNTKTEMLTQLGSSEEQDSSEEISTNSPTQDPTQSPSSLPTLNPVTSTQSPTLPHTPPPTLVPSEFSNAPTQVHSGGETTIPSLSTIFTILLPFAMSG